jgi:chorismate mutase/prephenate dehydratase
MARHPRGTAEPAGGTTKPAGLAGRSTDPDRPGPSPSPSPELRRIRRRIDAIDRRIVTLLSERAALGLTAGEAKRAAGRRAIRDPEREQAVLAQIAAANPGPLPDDDLLAIYRRIISATRRVESAARRSKHAGRQ